MSDFPIDSETIDSEELRDSVRKLLQAEGDSHAVRAMLDGDAARRDRLWQQMAELGWLGLAIDEEYGGLGQPQTLFAVLFEELGRQLIPLPVISTIIAAQALQRCGSTEQCGRWLPGIASGEVRAAIALPGQTDEQQLAIHGGLLTGTLPGVVDADQARLLVLAATEGERDVLVVLPADTSGLTVARRASFDRTRALCDVSARDVEITAEQILYPDRNALAALADALRLAVACDAVGGSARILELTVDYLKTRQQFGRPIGSFQALKHRCATWKIRQESAAALCSHAVVADADASAWAASAKYYACDAYAAIAGDAIQLHGGIGFTWEHDCHLFFKRARLSQVLLGDSAALKDFVAASLFH